MEVRHQREALREGRKDCAPDDFVFGPATSLRAAVRLAARQGLVRAVSSFATSGSSPERPLKVCFCLELFCGSARWSRSVGRQGFYVIAIDMRYGADHDLSRRDLQQKIRGWVQAHWVIAVLAGFPCTSFSRARNMPGGPPALRTTEYIAGLPGLRACDQAKVDMGNSLLRWVVAITRACLVSKTVCILENPWTSWAWKMPSLVSLLRDKRMSFTRSDFCCWGTPWRKSTGFATCNMPTHGFARACRGRKVCDNTGCPHCVLKGQNEQGVFWTLIAEPYPEKLCRALARGVDLGWREMSSRPMAAILERGC